MRFDAYIHSAILERRLPDGSAPVHLSARPLDRSSGRRLHAVENLPHGDLDVDAGHYPTAVASVMSRSIHWPSAVRLKACTSRLSEQTFKAIEALVRAGVQLSKVERVRIQLWVIEKQRVRIRDGHA